MTRNSGRSDRAAAAFGRMEPKPAETPAKPSTTPAPAAGSTPPAEKAKQIKYTVLLDVEDAVIWDQLAATLLRATGRRVDKSVMVRTLVYLAAEDEGLRRQLIETLDREVMTE